MKYPKHYYLFNLLFPSEVVLIEFDVDLVQKSDWSRSRGMVSRRG